MNIQIKKTRKALPELSVAEVETIIELITDYVKPSMVHYSLDCEVIELNITLNAARNKGYCMRRVGQTWANVQVMYDYPASVRLHVLAHELTHVLFPIAKQSWNISQLMSHDSRPEEVLANRVAEYVSGISHNEFCKLVANYNKTLDK